MEGWLEGCPISVKLRRKKPRFVVGVGTLASPSSWSHESSPSSQGDASVPTPHPHHPRPYECDDLPPKKPTRVNSAPAPTKTLVPLPLYVMTMRRATSPSHIPHSGD